ncbi:MAG: carbamoyl-phosphate synthase domain-containing protein, partial [Eubacterium sp.]|nr:carbamoyl-phosphate synthase domain-containing protein [Eubacterium sp.]
MKAYLILEDGTVFTGENIGSTREVVSEIGFNTSMTGSLEVLPDPSYAGQAVVMTYPL